MVIYPPGMLSPDALNLVWWPARGKSELEYKNRVSDQVTKLEGDDLHWYKSAATQIERHSLFESTMVAVTVDIDWNQFLEPLSHDFHLDCIASGTSVAEPQMDRIRFELCDPTVPQVVPGLVGFDSGSGFSAGIFYTLEDNEAYLVAGELIPSVMVRGLGLEIDQPVALPPIGDGEMAGATKHALRMYSDALMANTETAKFIQLMNLIEYLASPHEFVKMQKVKGRIALHAAHDHAGYLEILEDFKWLSSEPNSARGPNNGLRHNVVHLGKNIEDLIDYGGRQQVYRRLTRYAASVINDFIRMSGSDWNAVEEFRVSRKEALGV